MTQQAALRRIVKRWGFKIPKEATITSIDIDANGKGPRMIDKARLQVRYKRAKKNA